MGKLMRVFALLMVVGMALSGCTEIMLGSHLYKKGSAQDRCVAEGGPKVGNPYLINGIRYTPQASSFSYRERGIASWYGEDFHGKPTANGECYNMYAFTAAHKTLPLPTIARVTNLENSRSVIVKINDRGPYVGSRLIDLSYAAAQSLGVVGNGTAPVLVEAIGGPHHHPDGMAGLRGQTPRAALVGRDRVAETLPSVVPQIMAEEELLPTFTQRVAQKNAKNMPPPPPFEQRAFTSTAPLEHSRVYVQIGAFGEKGRAANALTELKKYVTDAEMAPMVNAAGVKLWRVRTGALKTLAEAEKMLQNLSDSGFAAAQIKIEKE
jgi:rare lipoprotein A